MQIIINNAECITEDTRAMLDTAIMRICQHQHLKQATIHADGRNKDGWLEFIIVHEYEDGGRLTVGCIQRKPGEAFEFHS